MTGIFFKLRAKRGVSLFEGRSVTCSTWGGHLRSRVFGAKVVLNIEVFGCPLGNLGFGRSPTICLRRILKSAIYRGSLFSGGNRKIGPDGVRDFIEG